MIFFRFRLSRGELPFDKQYLKESVFVCHDCGKALEFGEWIRIECSIQEYDDYRYCYKCYVSRMTKFILNRLSLNNTILTDRNR